MASSLVCSQFPIHNVCGGKLLTQLGQYPLRVRQLTLPPHVRTCVGQDRRLVCGQRQKLPGNKFLLIALQETPEEVSAPGGTSRRSILPWMAAAGVLAIAAAGRR